MIARVGYCCTSPSLNLLYLSSKYEVRNTKCIITSLRRYAQLQEIIRPLAKVYPLFHIPSKARKLASF